MNIHYQLYLLLNVLFIIFNCVLTNDFVKKPDILEVKFEPLNNFAEEVFQKIDQSVRIDVCSESVTENSNIYCKGPILEAVNYHRIYKDSKTYVDKPLIYNPDIVLQNFYKEFKNVSKENINKEDLKTFLDNNFFDEGTELIDCPLIDWKEEPELIIQIQDKTLRNWALTLNNIWKTLSKQMKPDVAKNPSRYSVLSLPKPFIIPGGRFLEFNYWDAYWIIKGLLVSEMYTTTKNMIENFVYIVNKYGFIPNGGRVYYLKRSHPPLLSAMVYAYYQDSGDKDFIRKVLPALEKEIAFFDNNRSVEVVMKGSRHKLYQYRTDANVPRPESYREDIQTAFNASTEEEKRQIWQDLGSAAESGWDFSTRWFNHSENLETIQTTNIVPVDLNSFMCWNFKILSYLYGQLDDEEKEKHYRNRYISFKRKFQKIFYVEKESGWYDYNLRDRKHNFNFYASMVTPLFANCYHSISLAQSNRILYKMEEMGVFNFRGGIPTSKQQWDYPNGWSPLNHMIIEGFRLSNNPNMQKKAFLLAKKWIFSNYHVFLTTNTMWEKYNIIGHEADIGKGGEYNTQSGFGWTNGVVLDLLSTYSDRLNFMNSNPDNVENKVIQQKQPENNLITLLINETQNNTYLSYVLPTQQNNTNPKTTVNSLFNLCILFIAGLLIYV